MHHASIPCHTQRNDHSVIMATMPGQPSTDFCSVLPTAIISTLPGPCSTPARLARRLEALVNIQDVQVDKLLEGL